ncbi:MAG: hypothetical protein IKS20_13115, partial [Victivallales bacterium]|nr:hypothetical protein [Victivallales bacterium]
ICGACGAGKQLKSETFFVCKNCGHKFKKLSTWDIRSMSKEKRAKYHEYQVAARKRRGLPDLEDTQEPVSEKPAEENATPDNNK